MPRFVNTKFLLADDDSDDADIFCEVLMSIDPTIQCNTVENGRGIFEFLKSQPHKPDVIFIDINMPVMNGWECLQMLKADSSYKDIPAVIYSTSSAQKDIETAYSLGALFFLSKPEDVDELYDILRAVATTPHKVLLNHLAGFKSVKLTEN